MQKLLNDPGTYVDDALAGILLAHSDVLSQVDGEPRAVVRATPADDKVAIVTGGGSGHLPLFLGYVGEGLVDGCAVGDLFASPSAQQMLAVMRAIDRGRGVLQLYGNYSGDKLNFDLAARMAGAEGIEVTSVRGADDVASAPPEARDERRGVAGLAFSYKTAGASAAQGADLAEVTEIARRTAASTRSMGVALSPCTLPTVGEPNFTVAPGSMEVGMGIHGEPGVSSGPLKSADDVVDDLWDRIMADFDGEITDRVAVLVNSLGATPLEELYIVFRRLSQRAQQQGLQIRQAHVGEYATSLEMTGASISVLALDDELESLLAHPVEFWPARFPGA